MTAAEKENHFDSNVTIGSHRLWQSLIGLTERVNALGQLIEVETGREKERMYCKWSKHEESLPDRSLLLNFINTPEINTEMCCMRTCRQIVEEVVLFICLCVVQLQCIVFSWMSATPCTLAILLLS